jgi:hypothetical protein
MATRCRACPRLWAVGSLILIMCHGCAAALCAAHNLAELSTCAGVSHRVPSATAEPLKGIRQKVDGLSNSCCRSNATASYHATRLPPPSPHDGLATSCLHRHAVVP